MATIEQWTPYGVALDVTATGGTVVRTSATQFTVVINASWKTHWSGAKTLYGMSAASGGVTKVLSSFGTSRSSGSGTFTGTYSISGNGAASKTIKVTFKNWEEDGHGNVTKSSTKDVTFSVNVPAWTSYTVSYNANGGSGAPEKQTKWKDQTLKLSTTTPTRTGYTFLGWSTSSTATSATYSAGGSYTANSGDTLYAVWKANTYKIAFNPNGGSGGKTSATKTYGVTLKLPSASSDLPKRTNYNFKGWSTSATATTATYKAGGNYTSNSAATLYAVWELAYTKPRIENFTAERCKSDGTLDDEGTYALVEFDWECDVNASTIRIQLSKGTSSMGSESITASGTRGSVSKVVGAGELSTENTYTVKVVVQDANGTNGQNEASETVYSLKFLIDGLAENKGISFGKTAELEGVADFDFQIYPRKGYMHPVIPAGSDLNDEMTPGIYAGDNVTTKPYINCPITSGTFTLEIMSAGPNGQLMQRLTRCDKNIPEVYERWYYASEWGDWYGGWIYPTLTSTFAMYGTDASANQPRYRKDGRMVEVRGIVTPTADIPGSTGNYTIFTLPNGYSPSSPIYVTCQGSGTATWMLRVNTDGKVDFSRYRNGNTWAAALAPNGSSAGTWLPFQVTYFAK